MPNITFRPDDDSVHERLAALASAHNRSIAVEMRHAVNVYLDLHELVRLREDAAAGRLTASQQADIERRIKDSLGRVLFAAISREAGSLFEDWTGTVYPGAEAGMRLANIPTPFEKVIDWIVAEPA